MASPDAAHGESERGYAMVAAVAAMALFALLALDGIGMGRGAVAGASAAVEHARLVAAANAGTAIAVHGLGLVEAPRRWQPSSELHVVDFDGMTMSITVEDEMAKVPLNFVQAPRIKRLFELAGVPITQVDGLVAAFLRLRGDPIVGSGVSRSTSVPAGLTAIDELTLLDGMTPAIYARLAPAVTVAGTTLAFDPQDAGPLARAVMSAGATTPQAIEQVVSSADRQPALTTGEVRRYGHSLAIRVEVGDGANGHFVQTTIVELTGVAGQPYLVRALS
ncbi:type II secretion system protein GspK [Polymorphobacter megasporae]|uniref:type II secretion system protein GspK n=1 Tax=Glacieibacterium megasporae TaxID=2835787 RepID=UPI001C1E545A|nr:type II secretion system protein GspK [Polymorphobacter megasporae]UAJ09063.1 general secretion pathway protein GspK [Polymorphobacter megasporae]